MVPISVLISRRSPSLRQFWEPFIIIPVLGLTLLGVLMVYSTTISSHSAASGLFFRHLVALLLGVLGAAALAWTPPRILEDLSPAIFGFFVLMLGLVLVAGDSASGARRWLDIGPLRVQPSEPAKIAFVLFLAHYLAQKRCDLHRFVSLAGALACIILPTLLVLKEPDLGTALAFPIVGLAMLLWAGLPRLTLFLLASPLITAMFASMQFLLVSPPPFLPLLWIPFVVCGGIALRLRGIPWTLVAIFVFLQAGIALEAPRIWDGLEPYQQARVQTFLYPERDPSGAGYQVLQSKIAIGSGCFWGQGFGHGSQKALAFLPRQHTDFIYSVVGEELGFWGGMAVLALFTILLLRMTNIAHRIRSRFGSLAGVGLTTLLFYHAAVNIAMTLGLAPVTGLPLPFISFGGSFLVSSLAAIGLFAGVAARRREP